MNATTQAADKRVEALKAAITAKAAELDTLRQQRTTEAGKLTGANRGKLRQLSADLQAAESELQGLEDALKTAEEVAQIQRAEGEHDALNAHRAAAVRYAADKAAGYAKMAAALVAFNEAAREAQACADGAARHAAAIRRHLPTRNRHERGQEVNGLLQSGFEAGVLQRLVFNAGIGRVGIHCRGFEMDMHGVPQQVDILDSHRKTVERLDAMLAEWIRIAHETSPALLSPANPGKPAVNPSPVPPGPGGVPLKGEHPQRPPVEPRETKWAHVEPLSTMTTRQREAEARRRDG